MSPVEGIYTAYLTGAAGQGMATFVFRDGKIAGADIAGLTFSGRYEVKGAMLIGEVQYRIPAESISITGALFERARSY